VVGMFPTGGWPSPLLLKLLSEDHPLNMNSEEASYITISASVGDIIWFFNKQQPVGETTS
jgi:hypothetical protein